MGLTHRAERPGARRNNCNSETARAVVWGYAEETEAHTVHCTGLCGVHFVYFSDFGVVVSAVFLSLHLLFAFFVGM